MFNLIKNEFIKIFRQKAIYICMVLVVLFISFITFIYSLDVNDIFDQYSKSNINFIEEEIKSIDINTVDGLGYYIDCKTQINTYELLQKYKKDWQQYIIKTDMWEVLYNKNDLEYNKKSKVDKEENRIEYDKFITLFEKGTWKDYVKSKIDENTLLLKEAEDEQSKVSTKLEIELLQYRLDNNIPLTDDYLNTAIDSYIYDTVYLSSIDDPDKLQGMEKQEYERIKEDQKISEYIYKNKKDLNNTSSVYYLLKTFMDSNTFTILILIIIVTGGIVSGEYAKGTIKNLLIRPKTRGEILTSKLITSTIIIVMAIIFALIIQTLAGLVVFGTSTLSYEVLFYNAATDQLVVMSLFKAVVIDVIGHLPVFLFLMGLSFALSTITTSTALASALPIVFYEGCNILGLLRSLFDIKLLDYFISENWIITNNLISGGSILARNIIVFILFMLVAIIPSYIVFIKRNIKNI